MCLSSNVNLSGPDLIALRARVCLVDRLFAGGGLVGRRGGGFLFLIQKFHGRIECPLPCILSVGDCVTHVSCFQGSNCSNVLRKSLGIYIWALL
jgi:hypothetical protein